MKASCVPSATRPPCPSLCPPRPPSCPQVQGNGQFGFGLASDSNPDPSLFPVRHTHTVCSGSHMHCRPGAHPKVLRGTLLSHAGRRLLNQMISTDNLLWIPEQSTPVSAKTPQVPRVGSEKAAPPHPLSNTAPFHQEPMTRPFPLNWLVSGLDVAKTLR